VIFDGKVLLKCNIFGADLAALLSRLRPFWDDGIHGRVNAKKVLRCGSCWRPVCITAFS
jgi:hypothetical protein